MNKKNEKKEQALNYLRSIGIVDGSSILAKVVKVSTSGMCRNIRLYWMGEDGYLHDITKAAASVIGWSYRGDHYDQGIAVHGCGMDMILHTVDCLSYEMGYGSVCQSREPEIKNKRGISGEPIKAAGLRYQAL